VSRIASPTPWPARVGDFLVELRGAARFAPASRLRYCVDAVLYRLLRLLPSTASECVRTIRLRDGTLLSYRRNRGDIQSLRDIWLLPTYEPPFAGRVDVVVDLGANIGFATLYFARRLGARTCVAVEPDAGNARLLRRNLEQNGIRATVLEAAVGAADGTATFAAAQESNLGRLTDTADGTPVPVVSMRTVLQGLDSGRIDLLKIDIEGAERDLFTGDTAWLDRVDAIMMEFHADAAAPEPILACIEGHGLRHIAGNSVQAGTTDAFVR
jgi:FkbM family methyltransferase